MLLGLQLHATWCVHHPLRHHESRLSIPFQCCFCHFHEGVRDCSTFDSTCLIEKHVIVFTSPLLTTCARNLTLSLLIELVPDANEGERLRVLRSRILIEAVPPAGERIERLLVRDVVDQGATIGTAIEGVAE